MESMDYEKIEEEVMVEEVGSDGADDANAMMPRGRRREQKDLILPISILIAAVMVAGALVFATIYHGGAGGSAGTANVAQNNAAAAPTGMTASATTTAAILALGPRDAILGSPNAPVTVIEYGDYQCPFCAQYYQTVQPQLMQQYINTGKVKMVFRDFPFLGPESTAAANAAQCAEDQNKFWAYHDALYTAKIGDVNKGGSENDGFFTTAVFTNLASQLGLNMTTFTSCLSKSTDASYIAQEKANGATIGVNSTPTTFVNGVMVTSGGQSVGADETSILQAVAAAVAQAK
jgi:protein-disulfide isomerase